MTNKVVLAGGTGFIGQYFQQKFEALGYKVILIARKSPAITWNDHESMVDALENAEMVINLAGKSVNCRYHEQNKKEILQSRTGTTKLLGDAVTACENPPRLWVNASTATIYRHAEDRPMTETDGEIGTGFSVDVATKWENTFFHFTTPQTRQVALRIAIVLGPDGGVITPYKNLVKFGLGGIQGNGKQMFSWIHVEDLFQIIVFLNKHEELEGVFNCSSPNPIPNYHLMRVLREQLNRPVGLSAPAPLLELGSFFLRTETELILKSRWVIPKRLLDAGYTFRFPTIEQTLADIL
ncbi:TIGR01777 family oxidoreductase [Gracilibacillus thailandensis]|uniref:TIGR01777 family protein n=1 Tax=Gracilibacillus thailandensis TaxID=563735 RepID=A0A6N7R0B4_9BACI|nr:TIGR01777 family oxidoreductase [Gracilibacillus thailandensis]MRI66932.1 TIGR01777 family protein [Gracilibacillus thailandensis]